MYEFRGLRVKAQVINLQKYLKPTFLVFTIFMVIFNLKNISIKSVFTSNLTFINPQNRLFRLKSQKEKTKKQLVISLDWFAAHEQKSTLTPHRSQSNSSKLSEEFNELTLSFQNPQKDF